MADSINERERGLAFGIQRAADTLGATLGVGITLGIVWYGPAHDAALNAATFHTVVLCSLTPAVLAVVSLAVGARDVPARPHRTTAQSRVGALGKPFVVFFIIVAIFDLGNSSDAFLVLRAQDAGISVTGILGMLVTFNVVYALVSIPAGHLSDSVGRRRLLIIAWFLYAVVYLGFGVAQTHWHLWALYMAYGVYYGISYGTTKAMIADLVPEALRGTAYGIHSAALGLLDIPASVIAGVLWQGIGPWSGFGAPAPFLFGGALALLAAVLMAVWMPQTQARHSSSAV